MNADGGPISSCDIREVKIDVRKVTREAQHLHHPTNYAGQACHWRRSQSGRTCVDGRRCTSMSNVFRKISLRDDEGGRMYFACKKHELQAR